MIGILKIEIAMPQGDIEHFWRQAIEFAQSELGMPIDRTEVIKIDGKNMANQETEIWGTMMGGIAVGIAMTQADEFLNKRDIEGLKY